MTKITRITTQKRKKNRYNIFLDDGQGEKYGFSVDEDILIEFHLRKGLELNNSTMTKLVEQDSIHKSYAKTISYLGYRMRTEKEIRDYLIKNEVDKEHIDEIVNKLFERNLIDDAEFATMFVRTRIQMTTKGPALVKKELIDKGVTSMIADKAVDQYTYEIQYEKAFKLATKRMDRSTKHSFRKQLQQLQATLVRNGFSQEVVQDVLAEMREKKNNDTERDAVIHQGEKLVAKHERKLTGYELRGKVKEALYRQGFALPLIEQFLDEKLAE